MRNLEKREADRAAFLAACERQWALRHLAELLRFVGGDGPLPTPRNMAEPVILDSGGLNRHERRRAAARRQEKGRRMIRENRRRIGQHLVRLFRRFPFGPDPLPGASS